MNMKPPKHVLQVVFLMVFLTTGLTTFAEEAETAKTDYIMPNEMSRDDQKMLSEYTNRYDYCMGETSLQQMQVQDDPRHVVDFAMKKCATELENLNMEMTARNFDPNFRQGYIKRISNRSANQTLKIVMMGMARKQSAAASEEKSQ